MGFNSGFKGLRIYSEEINRNWQQEELNKAWLQETEEKFIAGETAKD